MPSPCSTRWPRELELRRGHRDGEHLGRAGDGEHARGAGGGRSRRRRGRAGAARPLGRDHIPFPVVHGERGLGRADPPPPAGRPSTRSAVELIVGSARERPGEVLLIATGPHERRPRAPRGVRTSRSPRRLRADGWRVRAGRQRHACRRGEHLGRSLKPRTRCSPRSRAPTRLGPDLAGLDVTERVMRRPDLDAVCAPAPDSPLGQLDRGRDQLLHGLLRGGRGRGRLPTARPARVAIAIDESWPAW